MVPKMNLLNEKYVKTIQFRFKCIHFGYRNRETLSLAFLIIILYKIAKDTDMRPTGGDGAELASVATDAVRRCADGTDTHRRTQT